MDFGDVHIQQGVGKGVGFVTALIVSSIMLYFILWFTKGISVMLYPVVLLGLSIVSGVGVLLKKWLG